MPVPPRQYARKTLAEARRRYEQTRERVDDIAAWMRIGSRTFHTLARRLGWRKRRQSIPAKSPPAAPAPPRRPAATADAAVAHPAIVAAGASVAERIQRTVERELAAIEQIVARLEPASADTGEVERAARVLASLTRTLHEVMRLNETGGSEPWAAPDEHADDDRGPDDPDDFLRELARRMDAFAAARLGARIPDAGEAGAG